MEKAGPTYDSCSFLIEKVVKRMKSAKPSFLEDTIPRKTALMPFSADVISSVYSNASMCSAW